MDEEIPDEEFRFSAQFSPNDLIIEAEECEYEGAAGLNESNLELADSYEESKEDTFTLKNALTT